MSRVGGYILILAEDRHEIMQGCIADDERFAEPVLEFNHSRRRPLICFIISQEQTITHIAHGKRGVLAGTGLRRLNIDNFIKLQSPVSLSDVMDHTPNKFQRWIAPRLKYGGLFTPKSFDVFIDVVQTLNPECRPILVRFSREKADLIGRLSPRVRNALAQQKEAIATALSMADLPLDELQEWTPEEEAIPGSFLDGLPVVHLREDSMVVHDLEHLPGYDLLKVGPYIFASA